VEGDNNPTVEASEHTSPEKNKEPRNAEFVTEVAFDIMIPDPAYV
jgi:hypothetical protein